MVSFRAYVMAMDRVERRLKRVSAALDAAGIPYAVVGGNAVAAWVARVDASAARATRDVDLLVNEADASRISAVMARLGFVRHDLGRLILFVDPEEPSKRAGVHLVYAEKKVRPSYPCPTPSVAEATRSPEGFRILDLPALVLMKLTSFRDIDRVHVKDLISVGLVTERVLDHLPESLRERLEILKSELEDE